jgi:heptosyltransferase III
MKKAGIIPSKGIGDAIMMMIAANYMKQKGYDVTIYHDNIISLKDWLPSYTLLPTPGYSNVLKQLDRVIIQNDNSQIVKDIKTNRHTLNNLHICYPTYRQSKHGDITSNDIIFDNNRPMVDNVCHKLSNHFNLFPSKDINLAIPDHLIRHKHKNRVIIHPTSTEKNRMWSYKKYIALSRKLRNLGYNPIFCVSPNERKDWLEVQNMGFDLPLFPTLSDLFSYIYESSYFIGNISGLAHIASYMKIPSIIVCGDAKHMKLWQPGWLLASIILPNRLLPNIKYLRLREKHWQYFLSVKKVYNKFCQIVN